MFSPVPDDLAEVRWSWPRLFDPGTLAYDPPVTMIAHVHDNLAVGGAPHSPPPSIAEWHNRAVSSCNG
jgi:hypothetical protein